jgi:hypothetical protein
MSPGQEIARQEKRVLSWEDILSLEQGDACVFLRNSPEVMPVNYFYTIVGEKEFTFSGALFFDRTSREGVIGYTIKSKFGGALSTEFTGRIISEQALEEEMRASKYWANELALGQHRRFYQALERRISSQGAFGKTPELSAMTGEWEAADDWLKRYEPSVKR